MTQDGFSGSFVLLTSPSGKEFYRIPGDVLEKYRVSKADIESKASQDVQGQQCYEFHVNAWVNAWT